MKRIKPYWPVALGIIFVALILWLIHWVVKTADPSDEHDTGHGTSAPKDFDRKMDWDEAIDDAKGGKP
jgi:hypothetical protein